MPQQQQPQPQQFVPQQRPLFATPPAQTTPPRAASKPLLPQNPMQYAAMPPQHGGPRPLMMPDMGMMMGNNRSPHKGMGTSSRHALQQQQMAYESDMSNSMANVSLQTHASQQEQGGQAPAATSRPFVLPKEFVPQQFRAPAQLQHQQAQRNTSAPPKLQAPAEQYSPMPNEYMAQLEASQAQLHAMLAYGVITPETFTAASQQLVLAFTDPSSAMAYEQQQQSQVRRARFLFRWCPAFVLPHACCWVYCAYSIVSACTDQCLQLSNLITSAVELMSSMVLVFAFHFSFLSQRVRVSLHFSHLAPVFHALLPGTDDVQPVYAINAGL